MTNYIQRFKSKASLIRTKNSTISDFISKSLSKIEINVEGRTNAIPVVFINNDKEGVDESIVYSYAEDGLHVGDYFTWEEYTYLLYKEVKNIKRENYIDSFNAVRCNINFEFGAATIKAHYRGPMRLNRSVLDDLADNLGLTSKMRSMVIVPKTTGLKINDEFYVEDMGWRIEGIDPFTTPGTLYLNVALKNLVDTTKTSSQELDPPTPTPIELSLDAGMTYTFSTEDAYFTASTKLNIIERKTTSIKFIIPFGITSITIDTKVEGEIVSKTYTVI